jgi:uncharacterized membrane protein
MAVLAVGLFVTSADAPMAWVVWPVGYGLVLPLAVGYARRRARRPRDTKHRGGHPRGDSDGATELARAKRRYVEGDIDEAEFETQLEATLGEEGSL